MADTKISALTALAAADIATDDEMPIVDTSTTTTKKVDMADLSARTETMTNKTLTTPVISGTPAADGARGYDATQDMPTAFNGITAVAAKIHGTIATGVGTQTFINDVATDQDFTSMYTFPENSIYTNKIYRVSIFSQQITGTSTATIILYLKIGTTKVYTTVASNNTDGLTRSTIYSFLIFGREAAGAAANVSTGSTSGLGTGNAANTTNQPVALATNGTLTINFGVTWSGTGSTESIEQQAFIIEEIN